jgi:hypothetical protein
MEGGKGKEKKKQDRCYLYGESEFLTPKFSSCNWSRNRIEQNCEMTVSTASYLEKHNGKKHYWYDSSCLMSSRKIDRCPY